MSDAQPRTRALVNPVFSLANRDATEGFIVDRVDAGHAEVHQISGSECTTSRLTGDQAAALALALLESFPAESSRLVGIRTARPVGTA